ncbi:MAG: FAD-dependent oxidoreductase [Patescibacteria group bacterium]
MSQQTFDVIAVGAGIAGLSAGMYCGRFNLKTLVIGEMPGGVITTTHLVENYPGIISITGMDMADVFMKHAQKFGAEIKYSRVGDIEKFEEGGKQFFHVRAAGEEFTAGAVIIATGTQHKQLGVKGEKEFSGKGVSYCALCDAAFFKGKTVCLVGGGDSSAIEALILAEQCKKVYMIVRKDVLRAEPINHKKVMESKNIEVKFLTEIAEIKGDGKVESVVFKSGEEMPMDGVFVAVGHVPVSVLAGKLGVELDPSGQIKINRNCETNVPGIYAAGDVTDTRFKQAITGAAEAVTASYSAYRYLQQMKK